MPKRENQFYSKTPVAAAKKIAGTNPVGSVGIGAGTPPMVPKTPGGTTSGLGSEPKHFFRHHLRPHHQKGHLRLSGHPGAHQVGQVKNVSALPTELGTKPNHLKLQKPKAPPAKHKKATPGFKV